MSEPRIYTNGEWSSMLGEGIHTGFRKGTDHPRSNEYWQIIRDMPDDLWDQVLKYTVWGLEYMGVIEVADE